jgi:AraC family transcriptional regulator
MKRRDTERPLGRIAVVRGSHLVPLIAAPHDQIPIREQPWKDVLLERHIVRPGEIPEHEHPSLCLHLQIAGEQDFEWWQSGKNAIEHTQPGSLIVIPPGTRDRLRWQGSTERLILSVENDALKQLASQLGAQHPLEIRGAWSILAPPMRLLISEMGREAREGWPLGALYAHLLALGLQTNLIKNHSNQQVALPRLTGGLSLPKLKRAMEYMSANLAEDIGLEQIADEMGMSPSHFAHEFRNSTGATPYQYLLQQRLERAKGLLKTTRWPIQNVSVLTGFNYPANFVRTFRQRVGQSPDAWRKDHGS